MKNELLSRPRAASPPTGGSELQSWRLATGSRRLAGVVSAALIQVVLFAGACERDDPAGRGASVASPPASKPPPSTPVFTDATAAAGLDFVHYTGATGNYYLPEIMGPGCALLDYDGDGDLDIYAVQGALLGEGKTLADSLFPPRDAPPRNRLFRNNLIRPGHSGGELSFEDVTAEAGVGDTGFGMGCAAGDYDNDGRPDLYVTNFGPNLLYHNNGDGTFTDATRQAGVGDPRFSASAAFLDYDRDGYLDLFVTCYVDYSLAANRDCFRLGGQRDYCGPQSYEPAPDRLFRNNGNGTFTDVTVNAGIHRRYGCGLGVACADFNADGWIDIYVANDATPNQLWTNLKNGAFEDTALLAGVAFDREGRSEAGMGVTAGDFDRDGDDDIFVTNERGETNTLYRNLGGGLFEDATADARLAEPSLPFVGFGTRWFDYDNDGWLDLCVATGAVQKLASLAGDPYPYHQPDQLYRNAGGRFVETTAQAGAPLTLPYAGRGVAVGDADNDGDLDLLVANNNGPLLLLRNNLQGQGHWVTLLLVGTRSNRDGYGARVALKLPGGAVLRQLAGADGSYLSASDKRVHFGLGSAERVESITVNWPSGLVERWEAVAVDAQTGLREGDGKRVE